MKRTIFPFLLLMLAGCSSKAEHQTDRELLELKGFVKTLKTTYYQAVEKDGKVVRGPMNEGIAYTIEHFNRKGMRTQTDYFYVSRRKDESQTERRLCYFDESGELLLRDSLWSSYPDLFEGVYVYMYDADDQLTDKSFFTKTGKCTSKETFGYDDNGNRILRTVYLFGKLSASTYSAFDDEGNEIRATTTYHGGSQSKLVQEFRYDEQGRKTGYSGQQQGEKVKTQYRYTYNEHGDMATSGQIREGGVSNEPERYDYIYDSRDNWTRRTEVVGGRAVQIIEREIVYY